MMTPEKMWHTYGKTPAKTRRAEVWGNYMTLHSTEHHKATPSVSE